MNSFTKALQRYDFDWKEIDLLVITHGHMDHTGLAREIKDLSGAKLAIHQREADWLKRGSAPIPPGTTFLGRLLSSLGSLIPAITVPPTGADILIGDDGLSLDVYGIPGEVIYTPGHTLGSVSVLLGSGDAFVGDLAMNARMMRLTPGPPIFAEDMDLVLGSWAKLLKSGAKRIYPAHGKPFSADVFKRYL
jgi:glyoxylase-like metal-dependent hydrolase (beta-lactamase superfamily II)